jgi:hypothetical protein
MKNFFFFPTFNVWVPVPWIVMAVPATLITPNLHSPDISNFGNMEFENKVYNCNEIK